MEVFRSPDGALRYGFHDLIRSYAREVRTLSSGQLNESLKGLLTGYTAVLAHMARRLLDLSPHHRINAAPERLWPESHADYPKTLENREVRSWLSAELGVLHRLLEQGMAEENYADVVRAYVMAVPFLEDGSYWSQWLAAASIAEDASLKLGDTYLTAVVGWTLGRIYHYLGSWNLSLNYLGKARSAFLSAGDKFTATVVACNIGKVYQLGKFERAVPLFESSLSLFLSTGHHHHAAYAQIHLADVVRFSGDIDSAISLFEEAIPQLAAAKDLWWTANAEIWLGDTYRLAGRRADGIHVLRKSLNSLRDLGDGRRAAVALVHLGDCEVEGERLVYALRCYLPALDLLNQLSDAWWSSRCREGMAKAYFRLGLFSESIEALEACIPIFESLGNQRLAVPARQLLLEARSASKRSGVWTKASHFIKVLWYGRVRLRVKTWESVT
jgi:tetratricopeptide (TPR) repeat protein